MVVAILASSASSSSVLYLFCVHLVFSCRLSVVVVSLSLSLQLPIPFRATGN